VVLVLQRLYGVLSTGEQCGWVSPGMLVGAVWGVVCGWVVCVEEWRTGFEMRA
jgi:hypothetical protein